MAIKKQYLMIVNVAFVCIVVFVHLSHNDQQVEAAVASATESQTHHHQERKENQQQDSVEAKDSAFPLLYDRWNRETSLNNNHHRESIRDNEISDANTDKLAVNNFKSQQDYVCGRAVANKKYKDILLKDSDYQMSVARAKYRPIEIRMPRIIGGDDTSPGEFPWTVSIKLNGQPICGGSLIDKTWILTAAHCVVGYNPKNLTVRLGAYRIKDASETQTIDLPVSMFVVHKEYSMPRPFSNDIAMLKLVETVDYTDYIIPICLPTEDQLTTTQSGSVPVNDYSNNRGLESPIKTGEDIGGIVISTKMSDHEIAKCFNRLEQNYLSSIGLGAIADVATGGNTATNHQQPAHSASPSPSTMKHSPNTAAIMMSEPSPVNSGSGHSVQPVNGVSFQQAKPEVQMLAHAQTINRPTTVKNHHPDATFDLSQANPIDYGYDDSYFGSPWNSRGHYGRNPQVANPNEAARLTGPPPVATVKLSRLPINKELLREIQSIGSDQMPSLDLGTQAAASDFFVMASDLNQLQVSPISQSASSPPSTNRSQYKSNSPYYSHSMSGTIRTMADGSSEDDYDISTVDDPTKYSGLSGTVVGWGWIRELDGEDQVNNKGYPSVTLQKVKLPILRNHVCEAWFQSQSKKITLLPSQFCAGFNSGGKDACRGDSGGPMIIEDSSDTGRYKLIGIVSAGIGCARPSLPGLYTRVASFLPWINAQMNRY